MSLIDTQYGGNRQAAEKRLAELQAMNLDSLYDNDFDKWNRLYSEMILLSNQLDGLPGWDDITLEYVMSQ